MIVAAYRLHPVPHPWRPRGDQANRVRPFRTALPASVMVVCLGLAPLLMTQTGVSAQDSVGGSWEVDWPRAVRYERDGSMEIQAWGTAVLTLEQVGDRVTGTWATDIIEPVNWYVGGTFSDGRLHLEASTHDSSNPELEIVDRMIWEASVKGQELEGRLTLVIKGREERRRWRPWSGKRVELEGPTVEQVLPG